jgi:hypothetical protein
MSPSPIHSIPFGSARGIEFTNARGQVVGRLSSDGWLEKTVRTDVHQLRRPPAWAIDVVILDRLNRLGARGVRLTDERGRDWWATLDQFKEKGVHLNRGHGDQVALGLRYWWRSGGPGCGSVVAPPAKPKPANRQLSLFDLGEVAA